MLLKFFITIWLIMNGKIIAVRADCSTEVAGSPIDMLVVISCADRRAEEFIYDSREMKLPEEKNNLRLNLFNITIPNSFLINEVAEISAEWNLRDIKIINNLSDMDVEHLIFRVPEMNSLDVSGNLLTKLPDITDDSNLEYLYLQNNNINHLYGSYDLKKLLTLSLSFCNISFIQKNTFSGYNGILKNLNLANNRIKSLNNALDRVCGLEVLDLSNNMLEYLRKSDLCRSSFIDLSGNKIMASNFDFQPSHFSAFSIDVLHIGNLNTSLNLVMQFHPYAEGGYDIENLEALENIESLPSDAFQPDTNYKYKHKSSFTLNNILISEISPNAFRGLREEQILIMNYNEINILQNYIFNDSVFSLVDLSSSNISSIEANAFYGTIIYKLILSHNDLVEVNPNIFCNTRLTDVDLSFNNIESFEYLACENYIKILKLQFNYITSIDNLGIFLELTHLNVSFNQISNIHEDFGKSFPSLEVLDLSHNLITQLSQNMFVPLIRLQFLSLENNILTKINSSAFTYDALDFESLVISYNGVIEAQEFSKLPRLKNLTFTNSKITLLKNNGFMGLARLRSLIFTNVTIDKIVTGCFAGLTNLQEADFSNILKAQTFLISGFFKGLDSLKNLNISGTDLKIIQYNAFSGAPSLLSLILSHNNISSLETGSFFGLPLLESLYLNHNQLTDLSIGIFSGFRNLTVLDLSYNSLQVLRNNVMFPIMESLRDLNLEGNKLMELDHVVLTQINRGALYININDNLWKCHYLLQLLGNFTLSNIEYKVEYDFAADRENIDGVYCVDICKFVYCKNIGEEYQPT